MIMRRGLCAAVGFPAVLCWIGLVTGARAQAVAAGKGAMVIPDPPQQTSAWSPPLTSLPEKAVTAIVELYKQGMADPRGCEYREIEADLGYEDNRTEKTHGWVLPGNGPDRFAVGWNGLVYPLKSVGAAVSVKQDVADFLQKDEKQYGGSGEGADVRGQWIAGQWFSVRYDNILPLKIALLLRLGEPQMAEAIWKRWFALSNFGKEDPYLLMAQEWAEALYDRALMAHLAGKDGLSLASCRQLSPLCTEIEATVRTRGIPAPQGGYLKDLVDLPRLAADQERREKEAPYVTVLDSGQPVGGPERIAALVRDLEQVNARQFMNPGETDVSMDPIVHALVKEGEPAIEPLLKCLEEDNRMTRSEFTQGMQVRPGPLIPVYEPAFDALVGILNSPFPIPESAKGEDVRHLNIDERKALAAEVRAYWDKNRGLSPHERWYVALKDDNAGADAWFRAIDDIMQPTTVMKAPSTAFGGGWSSGGSPMPPEKVELRGADLRARSNPSVSELIIRRFRQVIASAVTDKSIGFEPVGKMILALATWDGKEHLDDIRDMARAFHERFPHEQAAFTSTLTTEAQIFRKRLELGDARALPEYADWLTAIDPKEWNYYGLTDPFQIMWHHPNEPVIQRAAEKIFAAHSMWVPFTHIQEIARLMNTPLVGMSAFRREVIEGLGDKSRVGTVKLYDNGNGEFLLDGQNQNETIPTWKDDPDAIPVGQDVPFRVCDYYAYELSRMDCFPEIQVYWPVTKRDAAIAACRGMLLRYGARFQAKPDDSYDDFPYTREPEALHPTFAKLNHPATTDDLQKGHAIFVSDGSARVFDLPTCPVPAQRPSRKYDPVMWSSSDGKTGYYYTIDGRVWQAEEVKVGGKWERYYGFEGRHQLEKVAASEIFFPSGYPWQSVGTWMDAKVDGAPNRTVPVGFGRRFFVAAADGPLPVELSVRNHNGIDEAMPAQLATPELIVSYSEKIPPEALPSAAPPDEPLFFGFKPKPPFDYGTWTVLTPKKPLVPEATAPVLGAAHEAVLLRTDLRESYDMSRPGTYRIKAVMHLPEHDGAASNEIQFSLIPAH